MNIRQPQISFWDRSSVHFFCRTFLSLCALLLVGVSPGTLAQSVRTLEFSEMLTQQVNGIHHGPRLDYTKSKISFEIVLPEEDQREKARAREVILSNRVPLQTGYRRVIPKRTLAKMSDSLEQGWIDLDDGSIVKSITVEDLGATELRVAILANLPTGGEIRFFSPHVVALGRPHETEADRFPVITSGDFHEENGRQESLWSPTVRGDKLGIEISLPSRSVLNGFSFEIPVISKGNLPSVYVFGELSRASCSNHVDVMCASGLSGLFDPRMIRTVARIQFIIEGNSHSCSGTLLRSDGNDTRHFFLTANHCIGSPKVARSVEAFWSDQQVSCDVQRRDLNFVRHSRELCFWRLG